MDNQEFENTIRKTLKTAPLPSRASLMYTLRKLEDYVTESEEVRYNRQTTTSNIINNKFANILSVWKSKRIILVPSFIILLFVGAFSLSPHHIKQDSSLSELVEQDAGIGEESIDYDDSILLTNFDESFINDLSKIQNEI